jgi:hypothetical protein
VLRLLVPLLVPLLALVSASAMAQTYSGTFTTTNQQGSTVTLVLKQDAQSQVKGTLTGNNTTFQVAAQATPQGLMGVVSGPAGSLFLLAQYEGASLIVRLAEPGPNGQPNPQATGRLVFAKAAAGTPSSKSPSKPVPVAGGQDGQISQFLTRNAWCGFTYNKNTGSSTTERVVFYGNGTVARNSGAQTYNSGPAGSVAGQYGSGNQGRWKVADGMLHLSQDGMNWTPQPLQVTQNSNGSPIIKSSGKEYMQCN